MFGLSIVKILFEDGVDDIFARNMVNNQLRTVSLPDGYVVVKDQTVSQK